jgi:hypothetical protein
LNRPALVGLSKNRDHLLVAESRLFHGSLNGPRRHSLKLQVVRKSPDRSWAYAEVEASIARVTNRDHPLTSGLSQPGSDKASANEAAREVIGQASTSE